MHTYMMKWCNYWLNDFFLYVKLRETGYEQDKTQAHAVFTYVNTDY